MMEFFRGWRRKTSVCTLLMACLLAAGWVRSFADGDAFLMSMGGKYISLRSERSELQLYEEPPYIRFTWNGNHLGFDQAEILRKSPIWNTCRAYKERGWEGNAAEFNEMKQDVVTEVSIRPIVSCPYLSIVVPLTLISAWLILSKPHESKPESPPKPNPDSDVIHA